MKYVSILTSFKYLSMLSPRKGNPRYLWGIHIFAFPTLRNLAKSLGPRAHTFDYFGLGSHLEKVLVEKNMSTLEVSTCF